MASVLLPGRYRDPLAAIYAFARRADDLADEGARPGEERLAELDRLGAGLERLENERPVDDPVLRALDDAVRRFTLPWRPFHDLLVAFRMDVTKTRYADLGELMAYCRCSANPVGRLLLHLFDHASERNVARADAVCTALQLLNFLQDLDSDYRARGRIYIPQDELARFGVSEAHWRERRSDAAMRALLAHQLERARRLLRSGAGLAFELPGRLGLELRAIVLGGERIAQRLAARDDLFARPALGRRDWLWVAAHALTYGRLRRGGRG
ncbi:MAG: squalene synthase HpnC [Gammaproteobacteria bacterium]|nr:squalene synthase HpnC [Gammaproteobacteria bacterium]